MKKDYYSNFKLGLLILMSMTISLTLKAQWFASPFIENRNVLIEELSSRGCPYCPEADVITNHIESIHPDRVWTITMHDNNAGWDAGHDTTYPNLNTTASWPLRNAYFGSIAYPRGAVNRSTTALQDRFIWDSLTDARLNEVAECNVGGVVYIDRETRIATIAVEVYYTGNSVADTNYLTVAMVQDSILGEQSGSYNNPAQIVNGTYCHMHVLRAVVNARNIWGEAISPTTEGTLITKQYHYSIPEIIGDPNGVAVDLNNIRFIAWVGEQFQTHTYSVLTRSMVRPILNVCELEPNSQVYQIAADANFPEGGSVSGAGTYFVDLDCTLKATPVTGWFFNAWIEDGVVVSTEPTYTFEVYGHRNLVAEFEKAANIVAVPNIQYGATTTGGGFYRVGETATVTVIPRHNYSFINWTIDDEVVSTDSIYTFTVTGDCTLTANIKSHIGLDETTSQTLVYPNPVNEKLIVEAGSPIQAIEIYNSTGVLVFVQKNVSDVTEIPMNDLPSGTYFLRLTTQTASTVWKFVKE